MTNSLPLITVAMPVYNAGDYLRLAVLSIVQQTYTHWELLLIDDGSTDNAFETISDVHDSRIKIIRDGENKGLAARLNACIDLANGQYIARMDQDDISYPDRFLHQVTAMQKNAAIDLLATRSITIDENNQISGLFPLAVSHQEICARPWQGFYFPHPTWLGKTEWFRRYRYAAPAPYFCEDQELLLRSFSNSRFETLNEVLFAYRLRGVMNWPKLAKTRRAILSIQLRHFFRSTLCFYCILSTGSYVLKRIRDFYKNLRQQNKLFESGEMDERLVEQWNEVLLNLQQS